MLVYGNVLLEGCAELPMARDFVVIGALTGACAGI
jgi:hypothetical protein